MLDKYREYAEYILGKCLQYTDHIQCILRATLPIGVKGRRKEEKKRVVPRAAAAYGRQLKMHFLKMHNSNLYDPQQSKIK